MSEVSLTILLVTAQSRRIQTIGRHWQSVKGSVERRLGRFLGNIVLFSAWSSLKIEVRARDEIDRVLAAHCGFTEEQLDFIINYDIKYRMGREEESGEES